MTMMTIPHDAVALSLPEDMTVEGWWDLGSDLLKQRRSVDWALADWMSQGMGRYGEQACFAFASDRLGVEAKQLRSSVKVASAFPAAQRATDVPFEVHAYLAQLPEERRLETLKRASTEHWSAKQARNEITTYRQQTAMFEDEDRETRLAVEIIRAWNRAPVESRRYFWELAEQAEFGAIVEDEAADA